MSQVPAIFIDGVVLSQSVSDVESDIYKKLNTFVAVLTKYGSTKTPVGKSMHYLVYVQPLSSEYHA